MIDQQNIWNEGASTPIEVKQFKSKAKTSKANSI